MGKEDISTGKKRGRPPTKWKEDLIEMNKNLYGFYENCDNLHQALSIYLSHKAFIEKTPIRKFAMSGAMKSNDMSDQDILRFFEEKGLSCLWQNVRSPAPEDLDPSNIWKTNVVEQAIFYDDKNVLRITRESPSYRVLAIDEDVEPDNISIGLLSINDHGYRVVAEFISEFTKTPVVKRQRGSIHVLITDNNTAAFAQAGFSESPFIRDNYPEQVTNKFRAVVRALTAKNPIGRLTIMSGPTGSGKTYFIKGLRDAIPHGFFVFVTTDLVESLGGPNLVKAFLTHKNEIGGSNEPLILIIEDADSCMVRRGSDNMNSISSLLNLSDGLLGECLDIRVITTTNAKKLDIDSALLRSGRLVHHVEFTELSPGHANSVYQRLCGKTLLSHERKTMLLSDVYHKWQQDFPQPEEDSPEDKPPVLLEGEYNLRARRKAALWRLALKAEQDENE